MIESIASCNRPRTVACVIGASLDFRSNESFFAQVDDLVQRGYRDFILDLSLTDILDSTGLGAIIRLYKRLAPDKGHVMLVAPSPSAEAAISITKIDRVLGKYPSIEAALAQLAQEAS